MNLLKLISAVGDRWNQSSVKYPLLLVLIVIADSYGGFGLIADPLQLLIKSY